MKRFLSAVATVGGLTMVSRVAGFIRDLLMASVLGAGAIADAFFVALKLPNLFRRISAEGAFNVAFVPIFSEKLKGEGRDQALAFARLVMGVMILFLGLFTLIVLAFMPGVIALIAPGFIDDGERFDNAVALARITFPYLLFISLASMIGGVMNVFGRFGPYAFLPVLFNLALIAALTFYGVVGLDPATALAWGVCLAGVIQLIWMLVSALLSGVLLIPSWPRLSGDIRRLWALMLPAIFGAGVVHVNIVADMILASFLGAGSVSHLYYADRLNQLPLGVIGVAIGTALLPMLSTAVQAKDTGKATDLYAQARLYAVLIAAPCAAGLIAAGPFFVESLFRHGAFTQEDARVTGLVLQAYALGLPAYILGKVFQTVCFANQDTASPVRISVWTTAANIGLSILLIQIIGVVGIALSTALTGWLQIILLARVIRSKNYMAPIQTPQMLLGLSALIMGACVYAGTYFVEDMASGAMMERIIGCAALVILGALVYAVCLKAIVNINFKDLVKR